METKGRVAVLLAAYNGMNWFAEQLESILAQTGVDVMVFVSVDRSTDGTEHWIDLRAQADHRIVVLPHGERFGGAARNFFRLIRDVNFSDFDYVSFADQDDIWFVDKLVRAVDVLRESGAHAYSSNVIAFWPSGRRSLIEKAQPQKKRDFLFEAAGPGCTYVLRVDFARSLQARLRKRWDDMQQVGLHDWFAYAFARSNGYQWIIDRRPGMLYRQHAKNQVGVNEGWHAFIHRARKVWNGWGFDQAVLIAALVGLERDAYVRPLIGGARLGYLQLALRAGECRRRFRDQLLFAASCMAMMFAGRRGNG
jgi:rhamnosyltransferase